MKVNRVRERERWRSQIEERSRRRCANCCFAFLLLLLSISRFCSPFLLCNRRLCRGRRDFDVIKQLRPQQQQQPEHTELSLLNHNQRVCPVAVAVFSAVQQQLRASSFMLDAAAAWRQLWRSGEQQRLRCCTLRFACRASECCSICWPQLHTTAQMALSFAYDLDYRCLSVCVHFVCLGWSVGPFASFSPIYL